MIVTRVFVCLCLLTVAFINVADSAKILGIFPMMAYSHYILGNKLLKELAKQGHEITVITAFPEKSPSKNWKDIDISDAVKEMEGNVNI